MPDSTDEIRSAQSAIAAAQQDPPHYVADGDKVRRFETKKEALDFIMKKWETEDPVWRNW